MAFKVEEEFEVQAPVEQVWSDRFHRQSGLILQGGAEVDFSRHLSRGSGLSPVQWSHPSPPGS
jgi:hypothetical protein